ncbi:MAG TPA: hypothetical protein PKX15_10215, partial [Bacteroidales bacterium]|nr:hypothetical protein [Bacteroidales bacterium]
MGDVATKSDKTLTMVSRFPNAFLRTAIEARRLNTTIDEMAKAGRSILNFQESVNAEMDASVLLGRAINLQRARELAYRRDLEGSTKEILRITKQIDFENLDVFQQEAFAKATGHSVDELLKMVQAERLWEKARRDPKLAEKVKAYEALRASNEKAAKDQAKNYELELKRRANQEQLTEISNMWKQIMMEAQSALLPIVSLILKMVIPAMYIAKGLFAWTLALKSIGQLIAYVKDQITLALMINARYGKGALSIMNRFYLLLDKIAVKFKPVVDWAGRVKMAIRSAFSTGGRFARVTEFFTKLGNRVKWVGNIINKLKFGFSGGGGLGAAIGRIFPILTRIGPAFGFIFKWVPILGWVITAAQVIYNLFKRWITIFKDPNMNIGQKILHGILAIPLALYDALIKPFVDAFKWIMGLFGGKSPSVLALNILKGIMAIGTTLLKIIIFPWRMAFKLIPLLFSKLNIKEGIKAVLSGLFKLITSPFVKSFKWIMGLFGGKSPSVLALNILKGITAISTTLFDAITAPWRMAFAWIFSKIPGMGKFAAGLRGGAKGMINSVEKGATEGAAGSKVTTTETKSEQTTQAKENEKEESKQREIDNTNYLQSILEGI